MTATVAIGEFARLTHLSVKTLRFYHEIALLEPVSVDAATGYRRYGTNQIERAQLIRRLRALEMPLSEIQTVVSTTDPAVRDDALRAHLTSMETRLHDTGAAIASLRALLTEPTAPIRVQYRVEPAFPALTLTARVAHADISGWCGDAFERIYVALADADLLPAGVAGATYSTEFFADDVGEVTAYVPVAGDAAITDADLRIVELPVRIYAVALHDGPFEDFDRTYGALGAHVAEHASALPDEPIRERYLIGPDQSHNPADYRTEVCWPITAKGANS
ncbi:MerR family transcriptional regulator [Nocardia camponoti]|uniref:MerR family transcriptional regulator n=1 Tax=Nocardia camponoti TaxID=1616106 RepID=A0A917QNJ3_9NOCA|nr:MerR family transcriptional regulator [Nocardia camponoti]GGK61007.1 MerR family transcriptional regulator [Nocardia camponoti]